MAWQPTEEQLDFIRAMTKKGAKQVEIYKGLGIGRTKWYEYKKAADSPEESGLDGQVGTAIRDAEDKGYTERLVATVEGVEDTLAKLLSGYEVEEVTKKKENSARFGKSTSTTTKKRHISPNATVAIFLAKMLVKSKYGEEKNGGEVMPINISIGEAEHRTQADIDRILSEAEAGE